MGKEVALMDDAVPLFFVVAPMIVDDDVLVIRCLDVSLMRRQLEFVGEYAAASTPHIDSVLGII
jgi:hypothetical protein